ncbi:MAG TPA: peptidoglycan-associated lipoprotein Pal [Vicinamibacteria bacterium]|nr:peptidoglycan-associated lipoprotein Pal [Vicinamibacteria bacterium]
MTRRFHLLIALLLLLSPALLLSACGGKKRGPAVATGPGSSTGSGTGTEQPVDSGPDIRSVNPDDASGQDFTVSDPSGEGGPLEDIHFEYDQADLTDQARAILERNAQWIKAHAAAKVRVEGHCDERGTVEYNLALGERRAQMTREYLVSLGVAGDRLTTVSYGKERPLDPGTTESAFSRNRRAHFAVSR